MMTAPSTLVALASNDSEIANRVGAAGPLELLTPAKLNLGLRLLGVRDDGYHLLESIFAPIELYDRLELEILPGSRQIELDVRSVEGANLPPALSNVTSGPENLAFRAASAFCEASGLDARIRIRLEKAIPAAAGMGGGSSDAAAVLRGLSSLTGGAIGPDALEGLALGLGADVPFFLEPHPSHVSGIGEIITPLDGLPDSDLVVANCGISLDTAEVYRAADALGGALTEPRAGSTMRAFSRLCPEKGDPRDESVTIQEGHSGFAERFGAGSRNGDLWDELLINDLEPAARRLCPPVGRMLGAMREVGAIGAGMTGSGATVYGVFESKDAACEAADRLREVLVAGASGESPAWIQVSRLIAQMR